MKKEELLLSIVIPTYNCGSYVEETLNSILRNNLLNCEIIVVDDGSTDNTIKILEKIKNENTSIRMEIVSQVNSGVSIARNEGINKARGKYVYFCDGDDLISENTITTLEEEMEKTPDLVVWQHEILKGDNIRYLEYQKLPSVISGAEMLFPFLKQTYRLCMGSFAVKRSLLIQKNIYFTPDCYYAEDLEFLFKVIINASKVVVVNQIFYTYVKRSGSAMGQFTIKRFDAPATVLRMVDYYKKNVSHQDIELIHYLSEQYFLQQALYSLNSSLQYLTLKEYCNFHRQINIRYPGLIKKVQQVLRKKHYLKFDHTFKNYWILRISIYAYSFCGMLKNSIKRIIKKNSPSNEI